MPVNEEIFGAVAGIDEHEKFGINLKLPPKDEIKESESENDFEDGIIIILRIPDIVLGSYKLRFI